MGAAEALGGSGEDRLRRADRIFANIAVPHAKHRPAFGAQPFVAFGVMSRIRVLTAIDLNHELCLTAREVGNVRSDRKLAREFWTKTRQ